VCVPVENTHMLKDHTIPDFWHLPNSVFLWRDVKKPLHPDSTSQQKEPNKKTLYVNNRELPIFWTPCLSLGQFSFLINPTFVSTLLSHKSTQCIMSQFFGLWRQELSTLACNKFSSIFCLWKHWFLVHFSYTIFLKKFWCQGNMFSSFTYFLEEIMYN
jgi:hypothetical protein